MTDDLAAVTSIEGLSRILVPDLLKEDGCRTGGGNSLRVYSQERKRGLREIFSGGK